MLLLLWQLMGHELLLLWTLLLLCNVCVIIDGVVGVLVKVWIGSRSVNGTIVSIWLLL